MSESCPFRQDNLFTHMGDNLSSHKYELKLTFIDEKYDKWAANLMLKKIKTLPIASEATSLLVTHADADGMKGWDVQPSATTWSFHALIDGPSPEEFLEGFARKNRPRNIEFVYAGLLGSEIHGCGTMKGGEVQFSNQATTERPMELYSDVNISYTCMRHRFQELKTCSVCGGANERVNISPEWYSEMFHALELGFDRATWSSENMASITLPSGQPFIGITDHLTNSLETAILTWANTDYLVSQGWEAFYSGPDNMHQRAEPEIEYDLVIGFPRKPYKQMTPNGSSRNVSMGDQTGLFLGWIQDHSLLRRSKGGFVAGAETSGEYWNLWFRLKGHRPEHFLHQVAREYPSFEFKFAFIGREQNDLFGNGFIRDGDVEYLNEYTPDTHPKFNVWIDIDQFCSKHKRGSNPCKRAHNVRIPLMPPLYIQFSTSISEMTNNDISVVEENSALSDFVAASLPRRNDDAPYRFSVRDRFSSTIEQAQIMQVESIAEAKMEVFLNNWQMMTA